MALSNITVTTSEANVSVDLQNTTVSVTSVPSNIIVGSASFVSDSAIREAISNVSPILYDNSTGVISFNGVAAFGARTTDDLAEGSTNLYFKQSADNTTSGTITAGAFVGDGSGLTNIDELTNAQVLAHIALNPLTVGGNLTVNGNLNYENVADLYVTDQKITLNANATTDADVEIISNRPQSTSTKIKWNETTDKWSFTNDGSTFYELIEKNTSDLVHIAGTQTITGDKSHTGKLTVKNFVETLSDQGNVASGTVTFDINNGTMQEFNLVSNVSTLTMNNFVAGNSGTMILKQDAVGHRIFTSDFSPTWKWVNNDSTLSTNPSAEDVITFFYDGTNFYGSINTMDEEGEIQNSSLANSNVVVNGVTINLGGSGTIVANANLASISVNTASPSGNGALAFDSATNVFSFTPADTSLATKSTSNLAEGTNLYYTDARSRAAVSVSQASASGSGTLAYDNSTGVITYTPPALSGFIDLTDLSVSTTTASSGGSLAYDDSTGVFTFAPAVPGIGLANLSVSTTSASSGGSLAYDNSTGAFTFAPAVPGIQLTELSVSQASASGSGTLAYDNSSGVFTYTPPDLSTFGLTNAQAQAYIQSNGLAMTSNLTSNSLISTTGNVQINSATPVDGITGFTFDATTNGIGLGTVTPTAQIHVVRDTTSSSTPPDILLGEYSDSSTNGNMIRFKRSNGTTASPTVMGNNDLVSVTNYEAHDGTAYIDQFAEFVYHDSSIQSASTGNVALSKEFVTRTDNDELLNPVLTLMGNGTIRFNKSSQKNFGSGSAPYGTANLDINGNFVTAGTITATGNITGTSNIAAGNISATTNVGAAIVSASSRAEAPKLYGGNITVDLNLILGSTQSGGGQSYIQFSSANNPDVPDGTKLFIQDSSATNPFANGSITSDNVFFTRKYSGGGGYYLLYTDEACQNLVSASTTDINPTTANVTYAMLQARDAITLGPDSAARSSNVFLQKARIRYDVEIGETSLRDSKVDISGDTTMTNYSGNAALTLVNNRNDSGVPTQFVMKQNKNAGFAAGVAGDQLSVLKTMGMSTNTGAGLKTYANVLTSIIDPSDGNEDAEMDFKLVKAGTETSTLLLKSTEANLSVPLNSNSNITTTGSFVGDASGLTNVPGGTSFGTVTVSGQTNIQASQANAIFDIASSGDITLSTSGNTLTIGGSGSGYGNAQVTNFLASGTSTGNIAYTGNLIVESGNTSLTVDNYFGSANTGSVDQILFNSDPGLFNGQPITFSGTVNSDLVFLNGNTYFVLSAGGGYYNLFTDAGTVTGLASGLGQEAPSSLVGTVRNPTNCEALVQGNVKVGQGGTLHADAFKPTTSGGTISFAGIRASDVGLGSGGTNFFFPETGGNTEGALLTAHSDNVGTWENTIDIEYDDVIGPEALTYTNYKTGTKPIETMFKKANGTKASPAALDGTSDSGGGDRVWEQEYYGHDGTNFQVTMGEHVYVDEATNSVATGVVPLAKEIYVRYNGVAATSPVQSIVKYRANKHIEFNAPTGTRGYGTQGNANIQMDGSIYSAQTVDALNVAPRNYLQLKNYTTTEINALSGMAAGYTVYNSTLNLICFYNGLAWRRVNDATM